jgi:hypothetical protein
MNQKGKQALPLISMAPQFALGVHPIQVRGESTILYLVQQS